MHRPDWRSFWTAAVFSLFWRFSFDSLDHLSPPQIESPFEVQSSDVQCSTFRSLTLLRGFRRQCSTAPVECRSRSHSSHLPSDMLPFAIHQPAVQTPATCPIIQYGRFRPIPLPASTLAKPSQRYDHNVK